MADIIGWVASKDYEIVGGDSYPLSITSFDWTVFAADIAISAVTIAPRDGDRIAETINGVQNTYELMPVGKRKCCEWFDTSGLMLTLHTKLIKSE